MEQTYEERTLLAEDRHWWYRGRRAIVLDVVSRTLEPGGSPRILDAGCGGGRVLTDLLPLGEVVGLEPSARSREVAAARSGADVVDGTLETMPFEDAVFDLAVVLDVLEHLEDDQAGLRELGRVVRPGGRLLVTVPASPRMWSRLDELSHHHRRYTSRTLRGAADASGWQLARLTHFNMFLLPVAVVGRKLLGHDGLDVPRPPVNRLMEGVLQIERRIIGAGINLPAGLSLLAVFRRD